MRLVLTHACLNDVLGLVDALWFVESRWAWVLLLDINRDGMSVILVPFMLSMDGTFWIEFYSPIVTCTFVILRTWPSRILLLELIKLYHRELFLQWTSPLLFYGQKLLLLYMGVSTRVWLFVYYLIMTCRLSLLFTIMFLDCSCSPSLTLWTVLLFDILVMCLSLTSVSCG